MVIIQTTSHTEQAVSQIIAEECRREKVWLGNRAGAADFLAGYHQGMETLLAKMREAGMLRDRKDQP